MSIASSSFSLSLERRSGAFLGELDDSSALEGGMDGGAAVQAKTAVGP